MAAWSETGPDTIVCGLDESGASSAAAAYADWLATNIGMKLQLSDAGPRELAGRTERTRFLVTAVAPEGQWTTASLCDLIERSRCPVVVLPEGAARVWMSPSRARRVVRPTVVCGAVGSPAAPEGVRQAAAAAAMLSGTLVLVEARSRPLMRPHRWSVRQRKRTGSRSHH